MPHNLLCMECFDNDKERAMVALSLDECVIQFSSFVASIVRLLLRRQSAVSHKVLTLKRGHVLEWTSQG